MAGKRDRFRSSSAVGGINPLRSVEQAALSAAANSRIVLELIPIEKLVTDGKNPRPIYLDWENPGFVDPADADYERKQAQLESVQDLARSIKAEGAKQAPGVYRRGENFQVVWGHRRVLAHRINGEQAVMCAVLAGSVNIASARFVENLIREDLDLLGRLQSYMRVFEEEGLFDKSLPDDVTDVALAKAIELGASKRTAYRYIRLLRAEATPVRELILEGFEPSFREIDEMLKCGSAAEIKSAVESYRQAVLTADQGEPQGEGGDSAADDAGRGPVEPTAALRTARTNMRRPYYQLGRTENARVVEVIIKKCLGDDAPDIDWRDGRAVKKAFAEMLKKLEQQVSE